MEELTISVAIADRPYRLTIKRSEEELIRKAANEINKNIKYYSDFFKKVVKRRFCNTACICNFLH